VNITINDLTPEDGNNSRGSIADFVWTGYAGGAPSAPTGVTATADAGGVTLKWQKVDGATGYRIFRLESYATMGKNWAVLSTIEPHLISAKPVTDPSYTDATLTTNGDYSYEVTALNAQGESTFSEIIKQTYTK